MAHPILTALMSNADRGKHRPPSPEYYVETYGVTMTQARRFIRNFLLKPVTFSERDSPD